MGVNEVDGMTDMDEWECVIECEMDDCESREGVGGWARCVFEECVLRRGERCSVHLCLCL